MVAHQAPKHFSQGEALDSSTNWNRFNEGHWRRTQPHQRMSDVDPQVRNFPTVDRRQHISGVLLLILSRFFAEAIFSPLQVFPAELDLSAFCPPYIKN